MEKFVCVDVEMPNGEGNRISAIGVNVFENGTLTTQFYSLVNPETWFQPYVIQLIGITPDMVKDAPNFPALWPQLEPLLADSVLVAHGAGNDLKALSRCLRHYRIDWKPEVPYICTVEACTACYPQRNAYSLDTICGDFGIELEHHQALSDSRACGELLLKCIEDGLDVQSCIKQFDLTRGRNKKQKRQRTPKPKSHIEAAAQAVREDLIALAEEKAARGKKLLPADETHLGLRDEDLFLYFRDHHSDAELYTFVLDLPHRYDEENRLHAIVLSNRARFALTVKGINTFLPFIETRETLLLLRPKLFKRKQPELGDHLRHWLLSDDKMTTLFGFQTLQSFYLKTPQLPMFLEIVAALASEDEEISEAKTAFFAAALRRAPGRTLAFLGSHVRTEEENRAVARVLEHDPPKRYEAQLRALDADTQHETAGEAVCIQ